MVAFKMWLEALVFGGIYSLIIIIPCIIIAITGRKMIEQIGQYPTKTPIFQMGMFGPLIITEVVTFIALWSFFKFFSV